MDVKINYRNLSEKQIEILEKMLGICRYLEFARLHKVESRIKVEQAETLGFLGRDFEALSSKQ